MSLALRWTASRPILTGLEKKNLIILEKLSAIFLGIIIYWILLLLSFPVFKFVADWSLGYENLSLVVQGYQRQMALSFQEPLMMIWVLVFPTIACFLAVSASIKLLNNKFKLNWFIIGLLIAIQYGFALIKHNIALGVGVLSVAILSSYFANRKYSR